MGIFRKPTIRNLLLVAFITLIVKALGFFKETVIASTFGLSEFLDAFLIAVLIPSFLQNVFISAFKNIFIPNYIIEQKSENKLGEFHSVSLLVVLAITISTIFFTYLASDYFLELVYPGHSPAFYDLIKKQLYYLLPCLLFWGISSFLSGILEIRNRFFLATLSAIFIPLGILFCIHFLKEDLKELVLAVGTLIGSFLGFIFLITSIISKEGLVFNRVRLNQNSKNMLSQLPAKVSSGFLTAANNFVDQYFAAQLAVGSIAAMNYGMKIPSFIMGITLIAMGNVLLPYFSRAITSNPKKAFKKLFFTLKITFAIGVLGVGLTYIFSYEIISFLFEKKEFDSEDSLIVSGIQKILLIYIPFYLCHNILVKFLTSLNENKFMAFQSLYKLCANIILNIILVKKYGVYGLAISTSIIMIANSLIYFYYTLKLYKKEISNKSELT